MHLRVQLCFVLFCFIEFELQGQFPWTSFTSLDGKAEIQEREKEGMREIVISEER